ncbi:hypothetical protein Tco_0977450 [Tanacetum coccineum]|uniref:Uncharacterized protein n=1 Tax=Tanacetum coccineum TaxID=301880 RepID=A0ABQ5EKL0_9ASTR
MVKKSKLDEDTQGKSVDPTHHRGMVGTLMYLIASRPDLTFVVYMCARYLAKPIKKHFMRKRIFKYQEEKSPTKGTLFAQSFWMRSQLTELWYLDINTIPMCSYNKSNSLCCEQWFNTLEQNILTSDPLFIKSNLEVTVELYFVNTEYQLANIFNKAFGRERIEFLINKLGMRSFTSETLKQLADEAEE